MHGNEPLKKRPQTQIKMEQPRHSLAPHLDSFTKSTPSPSPAKPNQNVLKTAESSLSLRCACPPALACQGHGGLGEGALWLGGEVVGCWELSREGALIANLLSDSTLWPPSIPPSIYLVCSSRVRGGGTSISVGWYRPDTSLAVSKLKRSDTEGSYHYFLIMFNPFHDQKKQKKHSKTCKYSLLSCHFYSCHSISLLYNNALTTTL